MNMDIADELLAESSKFTKINPLLNQAYAFHLNQVSFFPDTTFYPSQEDAVFQTPTVGSILDIPTVTKEDVIETQQPPLYDEISEEGDATSKTPFYHEVYSLMSAFGDKILSSLHESVLLMHNLLYSQVILLIRKCEDIMKLRGAKVISHEDVLFLLRRNKVLLKRLLQFLYIQDMNEYLLPGFAEYRGKTVCPADGERLCSCIQFLSTIEKFTGDLTHLFNAEKVFDYVLQKRIEKRYLMKNSGNVEQMNYFESSLHTSFCRINTHLSRINSPDSFKTWLCQSSETVFDITPLAVSIIEFLAIETVAGLVEKAVYLRTRNYEEKVNYSLPKLDFTRSKKLLCDSDDDSKSDESEYDDDDDDDEELEEEDFDSSLPEIEQFSYTPKKYVKQKNSNENHKEANVDVDKTVCLDSISVLPMTVLLPDDDWKPKYSSNDFIKHTGSCPPLIIPMKKDLKKEFIQKNPITPYEIRKAFIHYQHPDLLAMVMKTKLPYTIKRKIKLVCLALPNEEYEEM